MPAALAERRVAVGRLRIRSDGDELRLRLGLDRLLASADVRPARLPPAAILVVRSLADPHPGLLDTDAFAPPIEWQRSVAASLDASVVRAARPARGAGETANAVVFADRAELLACLARDWCDGFVGARWWWRTLGIDTPRAVVVAFAETPEAVPAAVTCLAGMGAAATFAARLPPEQAAALARAVATAFGVERVADAALAAGPAPLAAPRPIPAASMRRLPDGRRAPAPWLDVIPVSAGRAPLGLEQEAFLGIALALRIRPAEVRAPAFAAAIRAWRASALADRGPPPLAELHVAPQTEEPEAWATDAVRRDGAPTSGAAGTGAPAQPAAEPKAVRRERVPLRPGTALAPPRRDAPRRPGGTLVERLSRLDPCPEPELVQATEQELVARVETGLGGLFHLILVGQLLGLYGDFTEPARPGIRLDPWDFVTLVGRALLRGAPRDAVWRVLAGLAGRRPGDPPGRGFRPPRSWRVPAGWLEPFAADGTWRYAHVEGRLLLVHPAGFPVVDAVDGRPDRELARYMVTRAHEGRARAAAGTARERWVENLSLYVRARLAAALGVDQREAARLALRRRARILVADTRVDVVSSLADLPIELRLAGLDRDPGYVPAAGRSVFFHFE